MSGQTPVTLRLVARAAGVSLSTASYGLRNSPRLLPATCRKVQAVALRLGYRPNPIFAGMMTRVRGQRNPNQGTVLAYISAYESEAEWRASHPQPEFFAGALERATALDIKLEPFFYSARRWNERRLHQVLTARGIRGVVVAPIPLSSAVQEIDLDWSAFAASTIGYTLQRPMLHRVTNDHFSNMELTLARAQEAGYRRIGCVFPGQFHRRALSLWMAALYDLEEGKLKPNVVPPLQLAKTEGWATALRAWYRQYRPDFIVTHGPEVLKWLGLSGRPAPHWAEFSLGKDGKPDGGIDENCRQIGAVAVDLVNTQLMHNEFGVPARPGLTLVPGQWRWLSSRRVHFQARSPAKRSEI